VPKMIGKFLVKSSLEKMQKVLFDTVNRRDDFFKLMGEPTHIVEERKALKKQIDTLNNAYKLIKRDPDLQVYVKSFADELKPNKPNPNNQKMMDGPPNNQNYMRTEST